MASLEYFTHIEAIVVEQWWLPNNMQNIWQATNLTKWTGMLKLFY